MSDHPQAQILKSIHIRYEGLVWCVVGVEILVHIAVVEPFGAHIVEVVRSLEFSPIADELFVVGGEYVFFEFVYALYRIMLHWV